MPAGVTATVLGLFPAGKVMVATTVLLAVSITETVSSKVFVMYANGSAPAGLAQVITRAERTQPIRAIVGMNGWVDMIQTSDLPR